MDKRTIAGALAAVGAVGAAAYNFRRPLWQRALKLSPVENSVRRQAGIRIAMPDGITLAADLYRPKKEGRFPTILIRTPYGRSNPLNNIYFQRMAERGYNVVSQDCRGRSDSGGEFEPYVHEAGDGQATIEWIVSQPWSDGQVGMWGQSYVGYVQWAAASTGTPHLKAMVPAITMANLGHDPVAGFQLDRALRWMFILDALQNEDRPAWQNLLRLANSGLQDRVVARGYNHLPLSTVDEAVLGKPVSFYRTWMEHAELGDDYWRLPDFRPKVKEVAVPAHFMAGWYDIFLDGQLADYEAMRQAGWDPYLTVGPWIHMDTNVQWEALRAGLDWFDAQLKGKKERLRPQPVRLFVMGSNEWRDYPSWPPPAEEKLFYLHDGGRLAAESPGADSPPDHYRYDPADPTPSIGGALLSSHAGSYDNRPLEARPDVLTYSTPVLSEPLEIIGPVRLKLFVQSNRESTDFTGRLCDVQPDGQSINICDGFFRIEPDEGNNPGNGRLSDGSWLIELKLSPTAYRFLPGHRLRLQVASGAHPRVARNPGTSRLFLFETELLAADQTVFHDASRPSALIVRCP